MPARRAAPSFSSTLWPPCSYIGWGKTTHPGFGIPLMIGIKLAHPDRLCLNLMGDGAFGMSGTDIEAAVRARSGHDRAAERPGHGTSPGGLPTARQKCGVSEMHGSWLDEAPGNPERAGMAGRSRR